MTLSITKVNTDACHEGAGWPLASRLWTLGIEPSSFSVGSIICRVCLRFPQGIAGVDGRRAGPSSNHRGGVSVSAHVSFGLRKPFTFPSIVISSL